MSQVPASQWRPCFLDWEQYWASFLPPEVRSGGIAFDSVAWTEELCPFCHYSHLTENCFRIVTAWLRLQPEPVAEVALSLGRYWEGTWLDLQIASVKLATD